MAVAVELWSGETMRTAPDPLLLKQPSIILTMRFLFLSPFSFDVDFIINGCISAARSDGHLSRQVTCLAAHVRSLKMKMAVQSPQLFLCLCVRFRSALQAFCFPTQHHCHTYTHRHKQGFALPLEVDGTILKQTLGMAEHADGGQWTGCELDN